MSRELLIEKAEGALARYIELDERMTAAYEVVDILLPEIKRADQMAGVPDGSIVLVETSYGARTLEWAYGYLHGSLDRRRTDYTADTVIQRYGPLTVVWMP
jgi:hypothetical protein